MLHASLRAAGDRFLDGTRAIVCDEPIHMAGLDELILDNAFIELTASDQLKEHEGSAVECVIACAWHRSGKRRNLRVERGRAVRTRIGRARRSQTRAF
jgi:hypothetical protein